MASGDDGLRDGAELRLLWRFITDAEADETMHADLRSIDARPNSHDIVDLILRLRAEVAALTETNEHFMAALTEIEDLRPRPFDRFPEDWREQIADCSECERYQGHPIQAGICDTHRKPLYEREAHDAHEEKALGPRMRLIARDALYAARRRRDS